MTTKLVPSLNIGRRKHNGCFYLTSSLLRMCEPTISCEISLLGSRSSLRRGTMGGRLMSTIGRRFGNSNLAVPDSLGSFTRRFNLCYRNGVSELRIPRCMNRS